MKYFIDFEFLEGDVPYQIKGFNIPKWLIKPNNTIQPISVGICSSDGREYYAISKDFNLKEAWNRYDLKTRNDAGGNTFQYKDYWIRDNVLKPIYNELASFHINYTNYGEHKYFGHATQDNRKLSFCYTDFKWLISKYGKSNKQIAKEIIRFAGYKDGNRWFRDSKEGNYITEITSEFNQNGIHFYGYYSDYDWVCFCWLFGKMINLPTGFPMYCIDLKQTLDEKANKLTSFELSKLAHSDIVKHNVYSTYDSGVLKCSKTDLLKNALNYPKQANEHNALADAKWNKALYEFLETIK